MTHEKHNKSSILISRLAFSMLIISININARAQAQRMTEETAYRNTPPSRLISTFEKSYIDAGFRLKHISSKIDSSGTKSTRLAFEFLDKNNPNGPIGSVSYEINSPYPNRQCTPCTVETTARGYHSDKTNHYSAKELSSLLNRMFEAEGPALDQIRQKMGKSPARPAHP